MVKERILIPGTEDEPGLAETADTAEGMETIDEIVAGATADDMAETEDEITVPARGAERAEQVRTAKKKREKKEGERKSGTGNGAHYRKAMREVFPYLLAVLVLLAVTQTVAGVLWSRQERRLEDLYQTYGAEYGQE